MNRRSLLLIILTTIALVTSALVTAQDSPFLGIGVDSSGDGATITVVQLGSPAEAAGLQEGDVITAVNGTSVTADTIAETIQALNVGDTVTLTVLRDGESLDVEAELAARPTQPDVEVQLLPGADRPYLGVSLTEEETSIVISTVDENSPAAEAGLQANDVLLSINGETIENVRSAVEAIRALQPDDSVTLEVQRGEETLSFDVTLGSFAESGRLMIPNGAEMLDIVVYNPEAEAWQVFGLADENPLSEAGLQQGDVITQIDGSVYNPESLSQYLESLEDDAQLTLTVERGGELQEITVPASALGSLTLLNFGFEGVIPGRDGFRMMPLGGAQLGVAFEMVDGGARITEVAANSPAEKAGLQVDDIVIAVNGDVVDEERTLRDRMFAYEPGDVVTLDIIRGEETLSLDVTVEALRMGDFFGDERGFFDMIPYMFGPNGELPFELPEMPQQPAQPTV
jgi:S1-C subfamily serine protease